MTKFGPNFAAHHRTIRRYSWASLAFRGLMAREKPKKGKGHNGGDATLRVTVGIADAVARYGGQPLRFAPRPLLRSACPTI